MAEQIIDKIRSLTDVPVTHVIISHWHGDHNFGIYRYAEEFPNVQYISSHFTHAALNGSPVNYISGYADFAEKTLPKYKERIATGKYPDGTPVPDHDIIIYQGIVKNSDELDFEFKRARVTSPDISFDKEMTIHSGSRSIKLIHLGQANTEGDIVIWLPAEKLVASGDIVVLPTP